MTDLIVCSLCAGIPLLVALVLVCSGMEDDVDELRAKDAEIKQLRDALQGVVDYGYDAMEPQVTAALTAKESAND